MPIQLDRRRFLGTLAISAAALALPAPARDRRLGPAGLVHVDRARFPQSVASGDPRPDRLLLWTRVSSVAASESLLLQVAATPDFDGTLIERQLRSSREHDHCVRIHLTDLQPGQTLYYRFLLRDGRDWVSSPVGRSRSAPAPDADVPVRFAFMSCQDYGGRWYNTLLPLQGQDFDFILHLGDFIYETAGDPQFQSSSAERGIVFDDLAGAIRLGEADAPYYAARSLDNYRQIHRIVRTDPLLQALLERAPLVAIWDDHEFADDCWQATATYADGRHDEHDLERRRNAEQAYLEYMPIDPDAQLGDEAHFAREGLHPNLRIWRNLRFGRHVELFLTDTRSERPDHLVPEDAFPGEILFDAAELHARLPAEAGVDLPELEKLLVPYIDLGKPAHASLREPLGQALAAAYAAEGLAKDDAGQRAAKAASGRIAWPVLHASLSQWNAKAPPPAQVDIPGVQAADGWGLAWLSLGKSALFSSLGSRYMTPLAAYAALAAVRDPGRSPMSEAQARWLAAAMKASSAGWKLLATSISLTPIVLDLTPEDFGAPAQLRHRFLLNVDQWDGFPQARQALVDEVLAQAGGNVVALSGDIHAAFVSQHAPRVSEFTVPAVSSTTLADILAGEVERQPAIVETGRQLVQYLDDFILHGAGGRTLLARSRRHGLCVATADARGFEVELLTLPPEACQASLYEDAGALAKFERRRFRVDPADGQVVAVSGAEA